MRQRTIASEASYSGVGLHTGSLTTVTFKPAPPDSGITFVRTDLPDRPVVPALVDNVVDVSRGTTIGIGDVAIHTVEHGPVVFRETVVPRVSRTSRRCARGASSPS